jgi:hypothetical protein
VTREELDKALKVSTCRRMAGIGGINMELLKYGGIFFKVVLHLMYLFWKQGNVPDNW